MQFKEIVDYLFTPTSWLLFAPNKSYQLGSCTAPPGGQTMQHHL